MFTFGAGVLIGTPLQDANGVAIVNPSPIQFGILQEVTVDESYEAKELYGANSFPVDVGRGKGKITLKAKAANISAELVNAFMYGQTTVTGFETIYNDLTGAVIPATPFTITPTVPASGTWAYDLGVQDSNGIPYMRVASSPTTGQYSVTAGAYLFAAADTGKTVFINYKYTASTPASARKITVQNLPMGTAPFFQVDLAAKKNGNVYTVKFPKAMSTKISRTFKNDDYTIPEIEIVCFADQLGNISYNCYSE